MENMLENPTIRTYHYNAFAESILGTHKDYKEWLTSNYIQVMFYEDYRESRNVIEYISGCIFGCCSLLNTESLEKKNIIADYKKFEDFLTNYLNQNHSIYTFVDEFHLPNRVSYRKNHFEHDILLCGKENEDFVYLGYDMLGNYTKHRIKGEQLYEAIQTDNPCMLLVSLNDKDYKFNIQKFIFMLKQYVYSEDSRKNLDIYLDMSTYNSFFVGKMSKPARFGVSIYTLLEELFDFYNETDIPYDWRVLHLLYEHKQSIYQKIEYLIQQKYLVDEKSILIRYGDIVNKAKLIEIRGLKYQIKRDNSINSNIRDKISELKDEEIVLETLLSELIRQNGFEGNI